MRAVVAQTDAAPEAGADHVAAAATCLKISVLCNGRPVVQVSFPAYAILNLPDLVPDEVKSQIAAHALDLEQLAATFAARGCPQGELFTLPGPDNVVRAWME
jgi:hypothetical protein